MNTVIHALSPINVAQNRATLNPLVSEKRTFAIDEGAASSGYLQRRS
jgi:hypothetical protein